MDGLFFLMSVLGVGIAMWWALQNDAVPPDKPTTGLFAMLPGTRLGRRRSLRAWLEPPSVKLPAAPAPSRQEPRRRRGL